VLIKEQGTKSKDDTVLVPYSLLLNQIRIKEQEIKTIMSMFLILCSLIKNENEIIKQNKGYG
jgi:hypothetical protein